MLLPTRCFAAILASKCHVIKISKIFGDFVPRDPAFARVFSRRSAILKIVEEKALGTRLENLQRKQNWTAKSTNLEDQVRFCHRSSPVSRKAWTLLSKSQELKKYPRKTCGYGQPRGHLILVLNERSVSLNDGRDFCLLWLVILKSAWYSVGDTF